MMLTRPNKVLGFLVVSFCLSTGISISRAEEFPGPAAGLASADRDWAQLQKFEFAEVTQKTLNRVVAEGIDRLEAGGHRDLAAELRARWAVQFSARFIGNRLEDLGDHRPLSGYLANLYEKIRDLLGTVPNIDILVDINILNYAIPVVFSPQGDRETGEKWDRIEYRRHFIPFTQVAMYWSVYGVCSYYARGEYAAMKQLCKPAARELRKLIGRKGAPELSDLIWTRVNTPQN